MPGNLRILFVTSHYPHGTTYGSQLRVLNLCRLLRKMGEIKLVIASSEKIDEEKLNKTQNEFEVKLLALGQEKRIKTNWERLKYELDSSYLNTHYTAVRKCDREIMERSFQNYNIIWVHNIRTANMFQIYRWPRTILDIDDIPSRLYLSRMKVEPRIMKKMIDYRMALIWRRREKNFRNRFDIMSVCSENDKRYMGNGQNIYVIPNGFDLPVSKPEYAPIKPSRLGFIGLMDYLPNESGIEWFVSKVWPLIKKESPETRLRLVGRGSDKKYQAMNEDIDGLGYVENSTKEMATWTAMIVPIRYGGGTRVKIAEAFSRKCPVVSTSLGAFGYELANEKEFLLADCAEDFAKACVRLIKNHELAAKIAENAWSQFVRNWTWEAIGKSVENAVRACKEIERNQKDVKI